MSVAHAKHPAEPADPRLPEIERRLREQYGEPDHGNPSDPLDDLIFLVLSRMTQEVKYSRTFAGLRSVLPSWDQVRDVDTPVLEGLLRDAGLARTKADQIKRMLEQIERSEGRLSLQRLRQLSDEEAEAFLIQLPGVSRKIARCVMLYALGRDCMPVDTHVWRVARRLGLTPDKDWSEAGSKRLEEAVPTPLRGSLHRTLVAHGREICRAQSPQCNACVLADLCPTSPQTSQYLVGRMRSKFQSEPLRRYRVSRSARAPIVRFIQESIEASGGEIVEPPDPESAPFELKVRLESGEVIELICYAFLANKYAQEGRPPDEHRFQVKYGSQFRDYHRIFIYPDPSRITLMFGAHLDEGIFVAVDPAMHEWTRFSRSVEFKTAAIEETKETGWFSWDRDRSLGRRRVESPLEDFRVETLLGLTPSSFLRYVAFERVATGIDPGERLRLARQMGARLATGSAVLHPLERELGLPAYEILDLIGGRSRLKTAVRGGAAEVHLQDYLDRHPRIRTVNRLDLDGQPDFEIAFNGHPALVECKNVRGNARADGTPYVDFQKTRAAKGNPCSRYYTYDQFEILAACLHPITGHWEYRFCRTEVLPKHPSCQGRIASAIDVKGSAWTSDISDLS